MALAADSSTGRSRHRAWRTAWAGLDRLLGKGVAGDVAVDETVVSDDAGQHGLGRLCVAASAIAWRVSSRPDAERRSVDDEHDVDIGSARRVLRRRRRTRRRSASAVRSTGLPTAAEGRLRQRSDEAQFRDEQAVPFAGVGGHRLGPAGVADDGDPCARGEGLGGEERAVSSRSWTLSSRITPEARASASTATSGVAAAAVCERTARSPAAGAAALDQQDRLARADAAGDAGELARVAERLQIERDHVGAGRPPNTPAGRCRSRRPCCRRRRRRRYPSRVRRAGRVRQPRPPPTATSGRSCRRRVCGQEAGVEPAAVLTMPRQLGPTRRIPAARQISQQLRLHDRAARSRRTRGQHDEPATPRSRTRGPPPARAGRGRDDRQVHGAGCAPTFAYAGRPSR